MNKVTSVDAEFMQMALAEARRSLSEGGVPIGSVLVKNGSVCGTGRNRRVQRDSAIVHAEMDALEAAGRQPAAFYKDVTLYTTLSPCAMCSGAVTLYGIPRIVIGENDTFTGDEALLAERGVEVIILNDPECTALMRGFVADHPGLWNEDIGV